MNSTHVEPQELRALLPIRYRLSPTQIFSQIQEHLSLTISIGILGFLTLRTWSIAGWDDNSFYAVAANLSPSVAGMSIIRGLAVFLLLISPQWLTLLLRRRIPRPTLAVEVLLPLAAAALSFALLGAVGAACSLLGLTSIWLARRRGSRGRKRRLHNPVEPLDGRVDEGEMLHKDHLVELENDIVGNIPDWLAETPLVRERINRNREIIEHVEYTSKGHLALQSAADAREMQELSTNDKWLMALFREYFEGRHRFRMMCVFAITTATLALGAVSTGPSYPLESIKRDSQQSNDVGYVLDSDARWTTFLTHVDRRVIEIPTGDIQSRTPCERERSGLEIRFRQSGRYPACPS